MLNEIVEAFQKTVKGSTKGNEFDPFVVGIFNIRGVQYAEDLLEYCTKEMNEQEKFSVDFMTAWSAKIICQNWLVSQGLYRIDWDIDNSKVSVVRK